MTPAAVITTTARAIWPMTSRREVRKRPVEPKTLVSLRRSELCRSRLAAFHAGARPARMPVISETITAKATSPGSVSKRLMLTVLPKARSDAPFRDVVLGIEGVSGDGSEGGGTALVLANPALGEAEVVGLRVDLRQALGMGNGSGWSRMESSTLKMAVFAPMPRASVRMATAAKPGYDGVAAAYSADPA
jgi:hypothetical protein